MLVILAYCYFGYRDIFGKARQDNMVGVSFLNVFIWLALLPVSYYVIISLWTELGSRAVRVSDFGLFFALFSFFMARYLNYIDTGGKESKIIDASLLNVKGSNIIDASRRPWVLYLIVLCLAYL